MEFLTENREMWPVLLLLVLLIIAVFSAMISSNRAGILRDENQDLQLRVDALKDAERLLSDKLDKLEDEKKDLVRQGAVYRLKIDELEQQLEISASGLKKAKEEAREGS